jgi:DnaJ homolog subfamily C member 2
MVIKYHPDKNQGSDDDLFKAFQKASEVLSDPVKRRGYDSQEEFDDSLPKSVPSSSTFYATFGPVFERNSK